MLHKSTFMIFTLCIAMVTALTFSVWSSTPKAKVPPSPKNFKVKGSFEQGKNIYETTCAICHGKNGSGKGVLGKALYPPPTDFTNKQLMAQKTDWELFLATRDGGEMVGLSPTMAPYKDMLTEQQIKDLVTYIRRFPKKIPTSGPGQN